MRHNVIMEWSDDVISYEYDEIKQTSPDDCHSTVLIIVVTRIEPSGDRRLRSSESVPPIRDYLTISYGSKMTKHGKNFLNATVGNTKRVRNIRTLTTFCFMHSFVVFLKFCRIYSDFSIAVRGSSSSDVLDMYCKSEFGTHCRLEF